MEDRRRKVVPGSEVFFREDIRLNDDALRVELLLPPIPSFGELTILYRDKLWHLTENPPSADSMSLLRESFAVSEIGSVRAWEERYFHDHQAKFAEVQKAFLKTLAPSLIDGAGNPVQNGYHHHLAATALERLDYLLRATAGSLAQPKHGPIGATSTLLTAYPAYDRSLFLDGRRYEILTVREFFELWRRGFRPSLVEKVLDDPRPWRAKELSDFLQKHAEEANPNALSVVRRRLHNRWRPMNLFLDGHDWVPEPRGTAASFERDWTRLLGYELRRRALEGFL